MKFKVLSLFPEMIDAFKNHSIIKKGIDSNKFSIDVINYRDYTNNKHLKVDDTPYGGGPGMVLMAQPIVDALKEVKTDKSKVILLCPTGKPFKQSDAHMLAQEQELIFVCGHYEGYDERIREYVDYQYSVGDYVLTSGELAGMVMIDAIARLVDGVIEKKSYQEDSFQNNLLDHPQYTKPQVFDGLEVPEVLLSGNHKKIKDYRLEQAVKKTVLLRPDIIKNNHYDDDINILIDKYLDK